MGPIEVVEMIHWRFLRCLRYRVPRSKYSSLMRGIKMRVINMFTACVAAGLILSAVANASDAASSGDGNAGKSEVFNSTDLPWNLHSFQRISPARAAHYPAPDWSSAIGTGGGAATESHMESLQPISAESAERYPEPDWTAAIGTGAAAAPERRAVRIDRTSLP